MNTLPNEINVKTPTNFNDDIASKNEITKSQAAKNTIVMSYARDEWIRRKLVDRESEFMEFRNLQIFCGSFNANGKSPSNINITNWLTGGHGQQMQDCYICSFQEIVDLNAANVIAEGGSAKRTSQWADLIGETLNTMADGNSGTTTSSRNRNSSTNSNNSNNSNGESEWNSSETKQNNSTTGNNNSDFDGFDTNNTSNNNNQGAYRLIASKYLVGIAIVAFVKADHLPNVRDIQLQTAGVGIGGFVGNKGGVALRFTYGNSSICCVSSHLSAHRGAVASRNSDFHNILSKITFKDKHSSTGTAGAPHTVHTVHTIRDHDYIFWLGDLNYRIQTDISVEECYRRIKSNDLNYLRKNDQLNIERTAGRTFNGFEEGILNFKPTYKYIPGEDNYDDRPDKKMRAPAWCDRILWSCRAGNNKEIISNNGDSNGKKLKLITLKNYQREDSIKISDHKPVFGIFDVQVKMIVRSEQKRVYEELMRELDTWENDNIPKVSVDCNSLFFDQLEYKTRQKKTITITNTGQVAATFRFVPKLEDDYICKPWLSLTPSFSMLLPNESIQVHVEANVGSTVANGLNHSNEILDDILVMRLENGRDYFILISGVHVPSCFGASLESLIAKEGVSHVPREIWRLVNALYTQPQSLDTEGLFVESGSKNELINIRQNLDNQNQLSSNTSSHSLAESLLELLDSLADTVVPGTFYDALSTLGTGSVNVSTWCERFLTQLPTMNHNLFVYLVAFLKELLQHSERNNLNVNLLSTVFSSIFVRSSYVAKRDEKAITDARKGMCICLKFFLGR